MSHKSSELDLSEGLNVLTGPNNSGKSAVISALQLLSDLPVKEGDYMVRHGTNDTEVTVHTDANDVFTWKRVGAVISLAINGENFSRLQNNREHYLDKLHRLLKLPKVSGKETKVDFDIHFAAQKEPIFLINEAPSRAALFFASSSDAGRLVDMREKYRELIKNKKKEQQTLKTELEHLNKQELTLKPLDEMQEVIRFIQEAHQQIPKEDEAIHKLSRYIEELSAIKRCHRKTLARHERLQTLKICPTFEDVDQLEKITREYSVITHHFELQSLILRKLSFILSPPLLENEIELGKECNNLAILIEKSKSISSTYNMLAMIKQPPELIPTKELTTCLKDMTEYSSLLHLCQNKSNGCNQLQIPPILTVTKDLENTIHNLKVSLEKCMKSTLQLNQAEVALEDFIAKNPACPTCGNKLIIEQPSNEHSCHVQYV